MEMDVNLSLIHILVLIEAVRGGRPRMTVEKPLIVYEKPGVYTGEITDIYGY